MAPSSAWRATISARLALTRHHALLATLLTIGSNPCLAVLALAVTTKTILRFVRRVPTTAQLVALRRRVQAVILLGPPLRPAHVIAATTATELAKHVQHVWFNA